MAAPLTPPLNARVLFQLQTPSGSEILKATVKEISPSNKYYRVEAANGHSWWALNTDLIEILP